MFLQTVLLLYETKLFHDKSMLLFTQFRTFSSSKKKRHFYRFWHRFCDKVSWVNHAACSCKQKAAEQYPVYCWLLFYTGKFLKEKKKSEKQTQPLPPPPTKTPQCYKRYQGMVCLSMCRFHCQLGMVRHGGRNKYYSSAFLHRSGTAWKLL